MGHIYLSHSHPIAIYACPILSHGTFPIGMTFPWTSLAIRCIHIQVAKITTTQLKLWRMIGHRRKYKFSKNLGICQTFVGFKKLLEALFCFNHPV